MLIRSLFDVVVLAETLKAEGKPPHGILVWEPEILSYAEAVADAYAKQSGYDVVIIEGHTGDKHVRTAHPATA